MTYKNLRTLSKAYSYGNLDRKSYIRYRRKIIDETVGGVLDHLEEDTVIQSAAGFEQTQTTVRADNSTDGAVTQPIEALATTSVKPTLRRVIIILVALVVAAAGAYLLTTAR